MEENSWSTVAIRIAEMAKPSNEESRTLRRELPTVCPKPGSRGLNSNIPSKSSAPFWTCKINSKSDGNVKLNVWPLISTAFALPFYFYYFLIIIII